MTRVARDVAAAPDGGGNALEVFWVALRLGLTSFGGPIAHIGYFREEYVGRRKWVDEQTFVDFLLLAQSLPGAASSKLGIALGIHRAGLLGGVAAWLGFTLPSAIALTLFAFGVLAFGDLGSAGWLHGLKIVAVAVVALAVWGMARTLAPDRPRVTLALLAAIVMLALPAGFTQLALIITAAVLGLWLLQDVGPIRALGAPIRVSRSVGTTCLVTLVVLLFGLPVIRGAVPGESLALFDSFFRVGTLVFGGGHVVLPLLQAEVVPPGWIATDAFVAGYGAAQAVPGPLFTFAAYLGAAVAVGPGGWAGAGLAVIAIFLPSFLLTVGPLAFWDVVRQMTTVRRALNGVGAAVVGILLAALYDPIWTSAILAPEDVALALGAFGLLAFWKWPPWVVVVLTAFAGQALTAL